MFHHLFHPARCLTAFAVAICAWLMGSNQVQAGCGDHGYLVLRDNGEVEVVTPSSSSCPCKGTTCQKHETPPAPMTPPAPTFAVEDACLQFGWNMGDRIMVTPLQPSQVMATLPGHPHDIFQPPRA